MTITKIWHILFPQKLRTQIRKLRLYPQVMIKYNHGKNKEIYANELEYIKKNGVVNESIMFLGDFMADAYKLPTIILFDENKQLPYVLDNSKKLYFKRNMTNEAVKKMYNGLVGEQNKLSPHRYLNEDFCISEDSVLFDVGSAEGIFALRSIDSCKKIVLFECDKLWAEALEATFEPYKNKVEIVQKYVSDINDTENITLDEYVNTSGNIPNFIKMDIEGFEQKCLNGMKQILASPDNLKLAVCAYHSVGAEKEIRETLEKYKCTIKKSNGWMLETMGTSPTFVTCVLRVECT